MMNRLCTLLHNEVSGVRVDMNGLLTTKLKWHDTDNMRTQPQKTVNVRNVTNTLVIVPYIYTVCVLMDLKNHLPEKIM